MSYVAVAHLIFWLGMSVVAYAYVMYPILLWFLARRLGHTAVPAEVTDESLPRVSILIAAHDEEDVIEQRIVNALATDYPPEKLEIVIGSDGSTDGTAAIVRRYASRGVRLLDYPQRRGKASVLNSSVPLLNGEVVLFSDANTEVDPLAARRMARWFADPAVGSVVGRLVLIDPETGRNADGLYWKYETFLKTNEARLGSLLGANGAIYALRKELYVPIPADTIIDDFIVPLLARMRSGCEIVYDREAVAREETAPDVAAEFRRRVRIGAGGYQSLGILPGILDPRRGWLAFSFVSHKLLRWLCPFFLIAMLIASTDLALLPSGFYRFAVVAQLLFYLGSVLAHRLPGRLGRSRILLLPAMFTQMNLALLFGFWRWLVHSQGATWQRTPRTIGAGVAR